MALEEPNALTNNSSLQEEDQQSLVPSLFGLPERSIDPSPGHNPQLALPEHWDNWESDSVWRDVDILMNEFAFNPTV